RERGRDAQYRVGFRIVAYPRGREYLSPGYVVPGPRQLPPEAGLSQGGYPYTVPRWFADVNGDGRDDYCRLVGAPRPQGPGLEGGCLLSGGGGFEGEVSPGPAGLGHPGARWFADVNGDRRADFCRVVGPRPGPDAPGEVRCLLSTGVGFCGEISTGVV